MKAKIKTYSCSPEFEKKLQTFVEENPDATASGVIRDGVELLIETKTKGETHGTKASRKSMAKQKQK